MNFIPYIVTALLLATISARKCIRDAQELRTENERPP
jgi:hypothetical protein